MNVAAGTVKNAAAQRGSTRTNFSPDELLHFSRLITIGELSACFAHEVTNPLMLILASNAAEWPDAPESTGSAMVD